MRIILGLLALVWLKETPWVQALLLGLFLGGLAAIKTVGRVTSTVLHDQGRSST